MLTQFKNWGIKTKIMSILLVSVFVVSVAAEAVIIPLMESYFMNERQIATQHVVQVAYGILAEHKQKVQDGLETTDEAKAGAIALIRTLRYRGQEYFWIHDLGRPVPRMIMHPTLPALDGKVIDDPQYDRATGKRTGSDRSMEKLENKNLFVVMNEVIEAAGEGFVAYTWPKPKIDGGVTIELFPKISFVKIFEPWGWVIGSGVYVDDVKAAVAHVRHLIHSASIIFCFAAILIYFMMMRYISRPVINLARLAKRIATGEYGAQLPVTTNDEVGLLSESLNQMSSQVKEKTHDLETANLVLQQELGERKRAEEALKTSEEKFRTLVEKSFDIIFVLDANGVFQFVSPSWETHLGYPVTTVMGRNFGQFVHPDDAAGCFEYLTQVMRNDPGAACPPYRVKHANDSWKLFIANGTMHTNSTGVPLYIGIAHDITDEKRLEEERLNLERQLLQAQKMESLGVLAGGIAHDFNNLLTAVMGNADLALMRLNPESPAVNNLKRIEQASARAADLAKQMLDYSGKGKFVVEHLDMSRLVEEMLHMLEVSISKKAVLRFNLMQPIPSVEADATQMRQIIMNLVINASEAIGDKSGVIAITTGCMDCDRNYLKDVWLDENLLGGLYVYLEIADSGCGMDKDTLSKLFDPFFTTKFTGRGLGMAAVLGIVRGHKGAIKVYSELNKGTTFKILLPASDRPAELFNGHRVTDDWKGSGTVLLVDDEETVRGIGREMLQELGFTVITADDGREGVAAFQQNPDIAFVILDLTMPHMDGEQCFRELRQLKPDVKVIISSGYSEQEVTEKFIGKGLAGFIQKPYKLSVLKEAVRNIS